MTAHIHIVTALHCEAKALIQFYHLKKITETALPFPIFTNQDHTLYLIISGIGKIKAAAATAFLYAFTQQSPSSTFLNIGIAGGMHFNIGDALLVHKITEASSNRHWYPHITGIKKIIQSPLMTYDAPQTRYPLNAMIDMEGSAFFETATQFVTKEHVQIIKIISDNTLSSQKNINPETVDALLSKNLNIISELVSYLINLSKAEKNLFDTLHHPHQLNLFQQKWHFTHAQFIQLKEYLRRWQVQIKEVDAFAFCHHEKNATAILQKLMIKLDDHANCLH